MTPDNKLGLTIFPHPEIMDVDIIRFSWKDKNGNHRAIMSSILDYNVHATGCFLRDFGKSLIEASKNDTWQ